MKIYDFNGMKNVTGKNIKWEREQHSMSQTELAKRLQKLGVNIERDSISRMESGKRVVLDYELILIAKVFDIPVHDLIYP